MKCDLCGKNESSYHSLTIRNNELVELHICSDCSRRKKRDELIDVDDNGYRFLEGLLQSENNGKSGEPSLVCPVCRTTYREVKRTGLVGCANCYELFNGIITKEKRKNGFFFRKKPREEYSDLYIDELKKRLYEAVKLEEFEKAAELRDRIRQCEKDGFTGDH